jgi:hypothetical protein
MFNIVTLYQALSVYQGDQKIEKKLPNFWKNKPKQLPNQIRPKYLNQAQFESLKDLHRTASELLKYLQQTIFPLQKLPGPLKNSPNCEILPNLVTLVYPKYMHTYLYFLSNLLFSYRRLLLCWKNWRET